MEEVWTPSMPPTYPSMRTVTSATRQPTAAVVCECCSILLDVLSYLTDFVQL